jgi:uncharacterized protein (TIGR04255 family)
MLSFPCEIGFGAAARRMSQISSSFTTEELNEVFLRPAIREVAFEIRFAPRLRVGAELWRLQDQLAEEYPAVGTEAVFQPGGGMLSVNVFQNPTSGRVLKVSQENFVVAFTRYNCFEDFKTEALAKTQTFCSTFGVATATRVGLRYVNDIVIPAGRPAAALLELTRPFFDFDRLAIANLDQFVNEIRFRHNKHLVTLRSVFLAPLEDGRRIYVLDIDCHSPSSQPTDAITDLLDQYHDAAQRYFLDHITEAYKDVMRGK